MPDAERVRDFHAAVVGWRPEPVEMGGYCDCSMAPLSGGDPVAGVCHARGMNADLPAQWMVNVVAPEVSAAADRCVRLGGSIVAPVRPMGGGAMCVIRDPAGAVGALYQPPSP